jgi:hypothetical protein
MAMILAEELCAEVEPMEIVNSSKCMAFEGHLTRCPPTWKVFLGSACGQHVV